MTESRAATYALRLGDDALVLAQRLIEWTSNAPLLEEELALANTALDYLGRARLFYQYAGQLLGRPEDELAYQRDARAYSNALIYELPRGDFAFTMARQFLIDAHAVPFLDKLTRSTDGALAAIAAKAVKESRYHLRRSTDWILRLGDGTDESHRRVQQAFDELAPYIDELFEMDALERGLLVSGVAVDRDDVRAPFAATVAAAMSEATLISAKGRQAVGGGRRGGGRRSGGPLGSGRRGEHTAHLGALLDEMQVLQRAHPGLRW